MFRPLNYQRTAPEPARDARIDGLRGLAAISVLLFHVWLFTDSHSTIRRDGALDYVFAELRLGLYLFFVLSGFLLVQPFIKAAINGSATPRLVPYARNRLARIAPAYWLSLAGSFLLLSAAGAKSANHMPETKDVWSYLVFGQNFSQDTIMRLNPSTWSLPVELGFYMLVPVIGLTAIAAARRAGGTRAMAAAIIVSALAAIAIGLYWNAATVGGTTVERLALPAMLPYFAFGMLAALAVSLSVSLAAGSAPRHAVKVIALAGAAIVAAGIRYYEADPSAQTVQVLRDIPVAAGFAVLLVAISLAGAGSIATRVLSVRPLAALGTISYGVYLWHVPLLLWARSAELLPASLLLTCMLIAAVSIALGALSWLAVERPAIRWARRPRAPQQGGARPASAAMPSSQGRRRLSSSTA